MECSIEKAGTKGVLAGFFIATVPTIWVGGCIAFGKTICVANSVLSRLSNGRIPVIYTRSDTALLWNISWTCAKIGGAVFVSSLALLVANKLAKTASLIAKDVRRDLKTTAQNDHILVKIDKVCDWIPLVSAVTNLFDLFLRALPTCCLPTTVKESHLWKHLQNKEMNLSLFIPFTNIIYCYERSNNEIKELIRSQEAIIPLMEQSLQLSRLQIDQQIDQLEAAVRQNLRETQNKIQEKCPNLNFPNIEPLLRKGTKEEIDFWLACKGGEIDKVRTLLDQGHLNPSFYHLGSTPLLEACKGGHSAIVSLLLERGADVNQPTIFGISPIAFACAQGRLEVVQSFFPNNQDLARLPIPFFEPINAGPCFLSDIASHRRYNQIGLYLNDQGTPAATFPQSPIRKFYLKLFFLLCNPPSENFQAELQGVLTAMPAA